MRIYLVRHAHAGARQPSGRDIYRPLSPEGRERAESLVEVFADVAVDALIASTATRCAQTLEPLGRARGLEVVQHVSLWEGSSTVDALTHLEGLPGEHVVACSHGDVIPAVVEQLGMRDVPIKGRGCELGSIWVLERDRRKGRWLGAHYVSPRVDELP